jgi:hypothetical protein
MLGGRAQIVCDPLSRQGVACQNRPASLRAAWPPAVLSSPVIWGPSGSAREGAGGERGITFKQAIAECRDFFSRHPAPVAK